MKKLFTTLLRELEAGRPAVLCGIVASRGSTPRGAGAKMLVLEDGRTVGTIGGGAVEYRAGQLARTLLAESRSETRTYDVGSTGDTGMICGGTVEVLFQYIAPGSPQAREALDELEKDVMDRVLLFGAGHVARALAEVLSLAEFAVEVWDERPEAIAGFPAAAACRCGPYDGALESLPPVTERDYVVVMTHGHQADFTVLSQVLGTPAKYIGCIGSRGKAAAVRERLLAAGFTEEDVGRIHSPIGLPIGGETPGEIAISVAAQLIACRSGRLEALR